jgi:hypothetical protein
MANLRTPHNPRIAAAALRYFEINDPIEDVQRAEDDIRRFLRDELGFAETKLPTEREPGGQ